MARVGVAIACQCQSQKTLSSIGDVPDAHASTLSLAPPRATIANNRATIALSVEPAGSSVRDFKIKCAAPAAARG